MQRKNRRWHRIWLSLLFALFAVRGEGGSVDIDLTILHGNMLYAAVYNMVNDPSAYAGKTVKLDGTYAVYETDDPEAPLHACIVRDAAGCCASGLEFRLAAPQPYPTEGSHILLIGTLAIDEGESPPVLMLKDAAFAE